MVNQVGRTHTRATTQTRRPGFQYKFRSEQAVRDRAERQGGARFDSPFKPTADLWRPKAGENQIRILPPTWDDHEHFGYKIFVHSWVGSENGTYICPSKMLGKKCPICALAKQAKDNGDEEDYQNLKVKENYVYWIIDRDSENQHPQLYLVGWMTDRDIVQITYQKRASKKVLFIDHPDQGYDLVIRRSGEKLNTRYLPSIVPEASPIFDDPQRQDEVMQYIQDHPIPDMLHFYDAAYLDRIMSGTQEATDDELDEPQGETSQDYEHEGAEASGEGEAYDAEAAEEAADGAPWEEEVKQPQPAARPAARPATRPSTAPQRSAAARPAAPAPNGRGPASPSRRPALAQQEEVAEEEQFEEEPVQEEEIIEEEIGEEEPIQEEEVQEEAPQRPAPRPPAQRPATRPAPATTRPAAQPAARPQAAAAAPRQAAPRPAPAANRPQPAQRPAAPRPAPAAARPLGRQRTTG